MIKAILTIFFSAGIMVQITSADIAIFKEDFEGRPAGPLASASSQPSTQQGMWVTYAGDHHGLVSPVVGVSSPPSNALDLGASSSSGEARIILPTTWDATKDYRFSFHYLSTGSSEQLTVNLPSYTIGWGVGSSWEQSAVITSAAFGPANSVQTVSVTVPGASLATAGAQGKLVYLIFSKPGGGTARYYIDNVSLTIISGATYSAFVTSAGLDPVTSGAPDVDADGDGVSNAIEWVVGGNPNSRTPDGARLPRSSVVTVDPDGHSGVGTYALFSFGLSDGAAADSATETFVEYSGNTVDWKAAINGVDGIRVMVSPPVQGLSLVQVYVPTQLSTGGHLFVRLRASISGIVLPNLPADHLLWSLDATRDFPGVADGTAVSKWIGVGIASAPQSPSLQPVFRQQAVVFDGIDDFLHFPLWPGGVGKSWTLSFLLKMRPGANPYDCLCGCDNSGNRALELFTRDGGLGSVNSTEFVPFRSQRLAGSDNWHVLTVRFNGTVVRCRLDSVEVTMADAQRLTSVGFWNLGCSYSNNLSAPITVRWAGFYDRTLNDDEVLSLDAYLEAKKLNEYPPTQLFLGGGQSNFGYSYAQIGPALSAAYDNPSFAFGGIYGGTALCNWMRNNDQGTGYDVCPNYDTSSAPYASPAYYAVGKVGGAQVLQDWRSLSSSVSKNPKSFSVGIFFQGENDCATSTNQWVPNGNSNWYTTYSDPYALADSYGARAFAWNGAIRSSQGLPDMFMIYERVAYAPALAMDAVATEALHRQRKSLLDGMANDPRWFYVDTEGCSRVADNVHLSGPLDLPPSSPDSGSECVARSVVRLTRAALHLAGLSFHARMLAQRAIGCGFELSDFQMDACERLASSVDFTLIHSLVIPVLPAANTTFDQPRLRRCNLLLHLGDKYEAAFVGATPANTTVICKPGANTNAISAAVATLLSDWGLSDTVTVVTQ